MNQALDWWNKKHQKYATEEWINKPSIFSEWVLNYFPKNGKILEIGAGHGQDSRFFAEKGYLVTATDFSDSAIKFIEEKTPINLLNRVSISKVDIAKSLPFEDNSFDVVYAHLSLHYFDDETTENIFSEIYRVLKPNGIVAVLVNSTDDPEYGTGKPIGPDYYELAPGDVKHFYSQESLAKKTKIFKIIVLDNQGSTHK